MMKTLVADKLTLQSPQEVNRNVLLESANYLVCESSLFKVIIKHQRAGTVLCLYILLYTHAHTHTFAWIAMAVPML